MSGRFKGLTVEYQKGKDKMNFEDTKKFTESVLKYGTSLDNANKVMDGAIGSVLMKSHRKAAELDKLEIQFKSLTDKGIKEVLQLVTQYGLPGEVETIEYSHAIPLTAHEKITAELFDTYKRKNHDYGDSFTESLNEFGLVAGLVRVGDKVNRLKSLTKNEQRVNDESLRDTILDASNYLVMMAMWLDSEDNHG